MAGTRPGHDELGRHDHDKSTTRNFLSGERHSLHVMSGRGGPRCNAGNMAAHDPRVAAVECEADGRAARIDESGKVYPR